MSVCLKKETLLAFADGELPSDEMAFTERHIAACAACKQKLESIRATSLKVDALLSSLAPEATTNGAAISVARIPYSGANVRMRWTAVASVGVLVTALFLFVMIRRQHPAPTLNVVKTAPPVPVLSVEKKEVFVAVAAKPAGVGALKTPLKVRQFQALDDGEPIETGMIYRVSLPASSSADASATQSAKRIPAEVIVDEFGKVRAIRFLQ
jgi:anti-sigma factor RsiW